MTLKLLLSTVLCIVGAFLAVNFRYNANCKSEARYCFLDEKYIPWYTTTTLSLHRNTTP